MTIAYIALGANLGDAPATLRHAIASMDAPGGVGTIIAISSFYRTAPIGLADQPDYINAVVALTTQFAAKPLLTALLAIEARFGRVRSVKNAPRTLDLDLLLYGDERMNEPDLILPHPRMAERAFVLAPLMEIAPDLELPDYGKVVDLLAQCTDQMVKRLDS